MAISKEKLHYFGRWLLAFAILFSVLLRIKAFLHLPSLMIDEANVARNIAERSFWALWQPLDYQQYAPPLYLCWVKLSTLIFGLNEYALRLPALLSSLMSIPLIYYIGRHRKVGLTPFTLSLVFILFSFTHIMIFHGNLVKQYSTDALLALIWLAIALDNDFSTYRNLSSQIKWSILGAFSIWFSMPIVFVLASIGLYYFFQAYQKNKLVPFLKRFILPVSFWLINFLLYFFLLLKSDAESQYLQQFHNRYFLDYRFWEIAAWQQNWKVAAGMVQNFVGKTVVVFIWAIPLFIYALFSLIRKQKKTLILLLFPLIFSAVASLLHYYSFIPRLLIFTMPLLFILLAIGAQTAWTNSGKWLRGLLILFSLVVILQLNGWKYILPDRNCLMEETREVLNDIQLHPDSTYTVFVNHLGAPALAFYTQHYDRKEKCHQLKNFHHIYWNESIVEKAKQFLDENPGENLVLIWGHKQNRLIQQEVNKLQNKAYIRNQNVEKTMARALILSGK